MTLRRNRLARRIAPPLAALALAACATTPPVAAGRAVRAPRVLIVTMFDGEAEPWIEPFQLTERIPVPGLPPESPDVRCNRDDVCMLTTGMGHASAAASTMAVALDPRFDLRRTWFLVSGVAGIDPLQGTIGSVAWARHLVDFGIAHAIDARELPSGWSTGWFGIGTPGPGVKPRLDYGVEAFTLDGALVAKAFALTRDVPLLDGPEAKAYRARYPDPPANQPPRVLQCDPVTADTWWHGRRLGDHAREWTRLLTDGAGTYCTTDQEDTAILLALSRAASAGRVDLRRVAVLRSGANFDRPHPGQTAAESVVAVSGGYDPARRNLVLVGGVLVRDVVARWDRWKDGVPAD